MDVIADFQATDRPGSGGLNFEEVREAVEVFARQKHLAAIEVTGYNPTKDPDGSGAKLIVDLLAGVLAKRLEALKAAAVPAGADVAVRRRVTRLASPIAESEPNAESAAESALRLWFREKHGHQGLTKNMWTKPLRPKRPTLTQTPRLNPPATRINPIPNSRFVISPDHPLRTGKKLDD